MDRFYQSWQRFFTWVRSDRRGSSTLEYVAILAGALALATILYFVLSGSAKDTLSDKIASIFTGKPSSSQGALGEGDKSEQTNQEAGAREQGKSQGEGTRKKEEEQFSCREGWNALLHPIECGKRAISHLEKVLEHRELAEEICRENLPGISLTASTCRQSADLIRDAVEFYHDPGGFSKRVVELEFGDLAEALDTLTSVDLWVEQYNDIVNDPKGYLKRKGEFVKNSWNEFWEDPLGNLGSGAKEIIGWNDVESFITGKDPHTEEELPVANQVYRLISAIPFTKAAKGPSLAGNAAGFVKDFACADRSRRGSECSRAGDENRINIPQDFNRKGDLEALKDEFERVDLTMDDLPETIRHLEEEHGTRKTNNIKGVIGEYFMEKEIPDDYESLPTKIDGRDSGIDGLLVKRNEDGEIENIVVAESKFNEAQLQGDQMTREWIERKANEMINRSRDPEVQEAGRMLQAALEGEPYNGQTLSDNMIETRLYELKPDAEGNWSGSWKRDPAESGLRNDDADDDWNGYNTD